MTKPGTQPTVLCFGEMLWDSLPQAMYPGGAPMNVAYHLHQLGLRSAPVSAVGHDVLGDELLRRVTDWALETSLIRRRDDKPTGLVQVTLKNGIPSYKIVEDVAWDWIDVPDPLPATVNEIKAIIFGSLAQRSEHNRAQLARLRQQCADALQVFDVNLRAPYDTADRIWELAKSANLIKLNDDEIRRLLQHDYATDQLEQAARELSEAARCPKICITAGSQGAGLLMDSLWTWVASKPIQVKDTVGAGDSFLASLVHGLLNGKSASSALTHACRLAEFVASSDGATPTYTVTSSGEIKGC